MREETNLIQLNSRFLVFEQTFSAMRDSAFFSSLHGSSALMSRSLWLGEECIKRLVFQRNGNKVVSLFLIPGIILADDRTRLELASRYSSSRQAFGSSCQERVTGLIIEASNFADSGTRVTAQYRVPYRYRVNRELRKAGEIFRRIEEISQA